MVNQELENKGSLHTLFNNQLFKYIRTIYSDKIFFPVSFNAKKEGGKIKKNPVMPKGWQKLVKPNDNFMSHTGVALLCGVNGGIYVIDYDDIDAFEEDKEMFPELLNYYVKSGSGFHCYFKWSTRIEECLGNKKFKKSQGFKSDIDFQGQGACVFAPPSVYSIEGKIYSYTLASDEKNKIKCMTTKLMNYLKKKYQEKVELPPQEQLKIKLNNVMNKIFDTKCNWECSKEGANYKITPTDKKCLIVDHMHSSVKCCVYVNARGIINAHCFSHNNKNIKSEEILKIFGLDGNKSIDIPNEYYYRDYTKFRGKVLYEGGLTLIGEVFLEYYKEVFALVHNNSRPIWFAKNKIKNNIVWCPIKNNPFNTKSSSFNVKKIGSKGNMSSISIVKFIDDYSTSENITTYDKLDFIPFLINPPETKERILNTFYGFPYEYKNNETKKDYSKLKNVFHHIHQILCNGDDKSFEYFIKWLAHLIRYPMDKDGIPAIIMTSDEGTGKNLFSSFMEAIIGDAYFVILNDLDKLTGKFNNQTENKLLTICNEIQNYGGSYTSNDKLKSIISDISQQIEPKGQDSYKISNYSRFMFFSNNEWPVKIGNGDRRWFAMNVSNSKKGDSKYYKELAENYQNKKIQEIFFNYLIHTKIDIDIRKPPITALKKQLKWLNHENTILLHLIDLVKPKDPESPFFDEEENSITFYSTRELFNKFTEWADARGERKGLYTERKYSVQLKKFGFEKTRTSINGDRQKGFVITIETVVNIIKQTIDPDFDIEEHDI